MDNVINRQNRNSLLFINVLSVIVPVAVAVRGNAVAFDSISIQRSRGRGIIRVFVSDGLNTSFADVTGLTKTATP